MDCNKCRDLFLEYMENSLDLETKEEFDRHLDSCQECRDELRDVKETLATLGSIKEVEPPEDLTEKIIEQIEQRKGMKKMSFKKILSYAAIFVLGIFITTIAFKVPFGYKSSVDKAVQDSGGGITANSTVNSGMQVSPENYSSAKGEEDADRAVEGESIYDKALNAEKIIYEGTINLDVRDSKKTASDIKKLIGENAGFVDQSYSDNSKRNENETYLNHSYLVVRVPADNFDKVMEKVKEFGEETSSNINSTNVTTEYRDIKSELESLQIQEGRLLEYLKSADKVEDMITIETELNRVRTSLNQINTRLNYYDQRISYSTITINLREAKTLTTTIKSPFGQLLQNISRGFISSINMLLQFISFIIVLVFRLIPFMIIVIPLGLLGVKVWKKRKK